MQEHGEPARPVEPGAVICDGLDQEAMLRHRKNVRAFGLPVPARDPREPVRDIRHLDVERGGVEQIEAAA